MYLLRKTYGLGIMCVRTHAQLSPHARRNSIFTSTTIPQTTIQPVYRRIFFEALDLIICGIQTRFDQPGYQVYCKLENLLLKATNKENSDEELQFVTEFYGEDLNIDQLRLHLDIMSPNLPKSKGRYTVHCVVKYLRDLTPIERVLVSQVCTLASLIFVLPATNATSEHSFSTLRRIKKYYMYDASVVE